MYEGTDKSNSLGKELASGLCTVRFKPDVDLPNPFLYFRLEHFYANHRTFVKSRSYEQLRGKDLASGQLAKCDPIIYESDLKDWISHTDVLTSPVVLSPESFRDRVANPCGLVAKYHFSDEIISLKETYTHNDPFLINETSIASKNQQS